MDTLERVVLFHSRAARGEVVEKPLSLSLFLISERTICGTIHSEEACCVILIDKSFFATALAIVLSFPL